MNDTILTEIRPGAYHDSIVLMQLQAALAEVPGVREAAAVMGAPSNLELLEQQGLLEDSVRDARAEDLVVVVRAASPEEGRAALDSLDGLLQRRRSASDDAIRPKSLRGGLGRLPECRWVLISTPGRYAADLAREALERDRNVFLYSDNVELEQEIALKQLAAQRGLLLLGPDCGTTLIGGVGLGFANRVRRGPIGIVAASGTGLQSVAAEIHHLGGGISAALGTGGRDLSAQVGGRSTHQCLELLGRDEETRVIVLISKPPDPALMPELLAHLEALGKPAVLYLQGAAGPIERLGPSAFARSLEHAALLACSAAEEPRQPSFAAPRDSGGSRRFLRGLFAGGTLAGEVVVALRSLLQPLRSNVKMAGVETPESLATSSGHTVLDLGDDQLTIGRLHPMLDSKLRVERLEQEARDPEVAALLLDIVLGDGAEADPVGSLLGPIRRATSSGIAVISIVVGTEEDPQGLEEQIARLREAGATVFGHVGEAAAAALEAVLPRSWPVGVAPSSAALAVPVRAINVGLSSFGETARARGAEVIDLDWRPPAGGDERLREILARLGSRS